ncbi:Fungal transcriptional regulatory protein [Cordyceps militaris CM01]|uniref:Fungal transcriptional regulatory protein n=1 Tax=Cordyceps militaris (strain CM01) TaxID=983644 RepID=G3JIS9_CORMM|nr:Fungal transcriptional regulatory protein [Cordyceps militaris CM01]EGX91128.1 Fungal transcriptional regulatory protein [Cordyceps militaris CM01]
MAVNPENSQGEPRDDSAPSAARAETPTSVATKPHGLGRGSSTVYVELLGQGSTPTPYTSSPPSHPPFSSLPTLAPSSMILFATLPFSLHAATLPQTDTHVVLDAATGQFRCRYCDKEFGRGDVCRKHMFHCLKKDTEAALPELRRGRKPRACAACFASKVSCDKNHPCSRCLLRHLPCHPRDVTDEALQSASPSAPEGSKQSHGSSQSAGSSTSSSNSPRSAKGPRAEESMRWIKNLIDPRATSMLENMANDTSGMTERIPDMSFLSGGETATAQSQSHASPDVPDLMAALYPWSYGTMLDDALFNFDDADDINMLSLSDHDDLVPSIPGFSGPSSSEGMQDTSLQLVNALHELHAELAASDATYHEPFDARAVGSALSASNLQRFAGTFFRLSHVHFPIVHMASFRSTSSCALLLSLVVQGAFRSPPLDDVVVVRGLLRLAEEYVFRALHCALAAAATVGTTRLPATPALEALQAALVIVYLLVINNSVSSRRQSRVRRIPELAWAVRHLDLLNVRHVPGEDWQLFVYHETCIRVATWTAVADWHQCGMFRCMPVMATVELNCNHPCSPAVWDAADAAEFVVAVADSKRNSNTHQSPASTTSSASSSSVSAQSNIREFIDILMADNWNRVEQCPRDSYNIYNLTTAIVEHAALSNVAITADIMSMMPFTASALLRALARWQELWGDLTRELGTAALMKTGMSRHSNEMCHLTRKIVEASINKSKHPFFQKIGHETVTELYSFVID